MAAPPPQRPRLSSPPQRPRLSSPPVPAQLHEDLIAAEILARVPPDDPALLLRAAATCRSLRGLLADRAFLRRHRDIHGRAAPMLGFVFNDHNPDAARFVPTSSFRPRTPDHADLVALDARHGRVLLYRSDDEALVVWNPITDQQRELPFPDFEFIYWNAAVLCGAAARGSCDHLGCCNGDPFLVAFVGATCDGITHASTYSSEAAAWSDTIIGVEPNVFPKNEKPAILVGNKLYFATTRSKHKILEFDLDRRQLSSIKPPHGRPTSSVLMPADGGGLGFAGIYGIDLYLVVWTRKAGSDGTLAWEPRKGIDLVGRFYSQMPPAVVGYAYAEGLGAILLSTDAGVFAIDSRTRRIRKVSCRVLNTRSVIPYMSFYTPDNVAVSSQQP